MVDPSPANPGDDVTVAVGATGAAGAVARTATLDGSPLALDAEGRALLAAPAVGRHTVTVTVDDGHASDTAAYVTDS